MLQAGNYQDVCSSWEGVPEHLHGPLQRALRRAALQHLRHLQGEPGDRQQQHCDWLLHGDLFSGPRELLQHMQQCYGRTSSVWPGPAVWLLLPALLQQMLQDAAASAAVPAPTAGIDTAPGGSTTAQTPALPPADFQQHKELLQLYYEQAMLQPPLGDASCLHSSSSTSSSRQYAKATQDVVQGYLAADHLLARCEALQQQDCPLAASSAAMLAERMRRLPPPALYAAAASMGRLSSQRLQQHYQSLVLRTARQHATGIAAAAGVLGHLLGSSACSSTTAAGAEIQLQLAVAVLDHLSDGHTPADTSQLLQHGTEWCQLFFAVAPAGQQHPQLLDHHLLRTAVELAAA
jgi:hypothetical protein